MIFGSLGLLFSSFLLFLNNPLTGFLAGLFINISFTLFGLTSINSLLILAVGSLGITGTIHPYTAIGLLFGVYASTGITNAYRSLNPELTNDIDYMIGNSRESVREAVTEIQMDSTYSAYTLGSTTLIYLFGMNEFILSHFKGISLFLISISSIVALFTWSAYFLQLNIKDKIYWSLGLIVSLIFSLMISFILKDTQFNNLVVILPIILLNLPLPTWKKKRSFSFEKVYPGGVNSEFFSNSTIASIISGLLILNSNSMLLELFTKDQKNNIKNQYDRDLYMTEVVIGRSIHANLQFLSWTLFGIGRLGEMDGINNILDAWNVNTLIFIPLLIATSIIKICWIPNNAEPLLEFLHHHSIPSFFGNIFLIFISSFSLLFIFSFNFHLFFSFLLFIGLISFMKSFIPKHITNFSLAPLLLPVLLQFI